MPNDSNPNKAASNTGDRLKAASLILILLTLLILTIVAYVRRDDYWTFLGVAIALLVNPEALSQIFTPRRF